VSACDGITIDWEGQLSSDGYGPTLLVYPVSTNDYTVSGVQPSFVAYLNSNGRDQLMFTYSFTGSG
jgi:hypothetical protein